MAFVSHPHPILTRHAGEIARPWPLPGACSRRAAATVLPSPRVGGLAVPGPAGAASAV